ncbi:MAG: hypothetical protein ACLFUB_09580 [Cyclobacteriaceae bacterium]
MKNFPPLSSFFCFAVLISLQLNAQEITKLRLECGTEPPSSEEVVKLPYYNKGQYLVDKAIEKGLPVEKDYLQKLTDENTGKSYVDYKAELTSSSSEFKSLTSSSSHYYIPVQAYVWENSSGVLPFTGQEVEDEIDQVNQYFEDNGVPITQYLIKNKPL